MLQQESTIFIFYRGIIIPVILCIGKTVLFPFRILFCLFLFFFLFPASHVILYSWKTRLPNSVAREGVTMIIGIGVDLCSISRIQKILEREGPDGPFFRRAFTPAEQAEGESRHNKAEFYAARFAVKEAVFKAVAPRTTGSFDFRIVESLHHEDGSPYVHINDALAPILQEAGIRILHLSVTTENGFAEAFVIAES